MILIASTEKTPGTMHAPQFPIKDLEVSFAASASRPYAEVHADVWANKTQGLKQGENVIITKVQFKTALFDLMTKGLRPNEWLDAVPFSQVLDSGVRGPELYPLAGDEDADNSFVWFLQVMARSVEGFRMGVVLEKTPLIHPMLGITYTFPEHRMFTAKNHTQYWPLRYKENWFYVAKTAVVKKGEPMTAVYDLIAVA